MKLLPMLCAGLAVAISSLGCASKGAVKPEAVPVAEATPVPSATPQAEAAVEKAPRVHYIVRKGDSLWKIASMEGVLGDSMRWPLLYKQNRDQIMDPDLIEIGLDMDYGKMESAQEVTEAINEAKETPPYAPHSEARKPLPVKY